MTNNEDESYLRELKQSAKPVRLDAAECLEYVTEEFNGTVEMCVDPVAIVSALHLFYGDGNIRGAQQEREKICKWLESESVAFLPINGRETKRDYGQLLCGTEKFTKYRKGKLRC